MQEGTGIAVGVSALVRTWYDYEGRLATARSLLDETTWEAAWSEGRAMTPDQAVEYALGEALPAEEPAPQAATVTATRRHAPKTGQPLPETLTERELEVLALISAGLSNRQIAARLFIAVSTAKSYVNAIFKKLGVQSRTRAVAEARKLRLVSEE